MKSPQHQLPKLRETLDSSKGFTPFRVGVALVFGKMRLHERLFGIGR